MLSYGTLLTTLVAYLLAEMLPESLAEAREDIALLFQFTMAPNVKLLPPVSALFSGISGLLSRFFAAARE